MLNYYVVDAFADEVFQGNPAGVCILHEWLEPALMEHIAAENNLSETGFAVKVADTPCTYELRWFTPTGEIDLCGHCTFGTAYVLFRFYEEDETVIHFNALAAGHHLVVSRKDDQLTMDFPSIPPYPIAYEDYMGEGVGAKPEAVLRTQRDLVLVFDSEETVKNLAPDFEKLKAFPLCMSVYATAPSSDERFDVVARAFWPKIGINEDPVCGSMYSTLTPYWAERLGRNTLRAWNHSRRGGALEATLEGDVVKITGRGSLYLTGSILMDGQGGKPASDRL